MRTDFHAVIRFAIEFLPCARTRALLVLMAITAGCSASNDVSASKGSGGHASTHRAGAGGHAGGAAGKASGASGKAAARDAGESTAPPLTAEDLPAATAVQIGSGYSLAEGPIWDVCGNRLLFVDVNASTIYQLDADDKISTFMSDTNYTNGIAFDIDGSLLMAQMGGGKGGKIARRDASGDVTVVVDHDPDGALLHTVDDVVVRSDGTIYFTDADYPHGNYFPTSFGSKFPLYALEAGSGMRTLFKGDSFSGPNGIELSPDQNTLYMDAYGEGSVVQFDVAEDGTFTQRGPLVTGLTAPDSLCVDAAGNLYVGTSTGLQVIRPDGTQVALIPIPSAPAVTNCTFGGADGKTLYVTGWSGLWKLDGMPNQGLDWTLNQDRQHCK